MDDASLFGSGISALVPSAMPDEGLADGSGSRAPILGDSDDLFSSNSYKTTDRTNRRQVDPDTTEPDTFKSVRKSDPLSDSNEKTAGYSAPLFEDSMDSRSDDTVKPVVDAKKVEDDLSKAEETKSADKSTAVPLFGDESKENLFNFSTDDDKLRSQKFKPVEDDVADDDLFKPNRKNLFSPPPLDFESEASASGDFMINGKTTSPNEELFSGGSAFDQDDIFASLPTRTMENKKKVEERKKEDKKKDSKKESEVNVLL